MPMITERPQDKWLAPDAAADFRSYSEQRMKGAWYRVIWSGVILLLFVGNLLRLLDGSTHDDSSMIFMILPVIVLLRFGYYVWKLIEARRDVSAFKRSLGIVG